MVVTGEAFALFTDFVLLFMDSLLEDGRVFNALLFAFIRIDVDVTDAKRQILLA